MNKRSRKIKLVICLLVLLVAAAIAFFISGWRSPTAQIAFRRMEKRQLLGPAQIIGTEDICCNYYNHMIVGTSEYGYTVFTWYDSANWDLGDLNYFPKQDDVTLFLPLDVYIITGIEDTWLPVMAFTEDPSALRARLTLQLDNGQDIETFEAEATRTDSGYFLFRLDEDVISNASVWRLLRALSVHDTSDSTVTASITFFDRNGHAQNTYSPELQIPDN